MEVIKNRLFKMPNIKIIIGYLLTFLLVWYCGVHFKTGPCAPNLDILVWFTALLTSLFLFIKKIILTLYHKEREKFPAVVIHLIGFGLLSLMGLL